MTHAKALGSDSDENFLRFLSNSSITIRLDYSCQDLGVDRLLKASKNSSNHNEHWDSTPLIEFGINAMVL